MGLNDSEGSVPSLACRGLGMQRSVKSQALTLHRGPIVLHSQSIANPHKARAFCCLCRFHPALHVAGFPTSVLFFFFFTFLFTFIPALLLVFPMTFTESSKLLFSLLPSCRSTVAQCLVRGLYLVYLLNPTPRSKPQLVAKVATLRPRLTAPKQEAGNSGQLVLLSGTLACHAFNSLSCCLFPL